MALSISNGLHHEPMECELCETDKNIQWSCKKCNKFMCNKCRNIHMKVKTSTDHEIIKMDDIGKQQSVVKDNILCNVHEQTTASMFCCTCDFLVCSDCICNSHLKHDLKSIELIFKDKKDKLVQLDATISHDLMLCRSEAKEVHSTQTVWDSLYEETLEKLDWKEQVIKDEISKYVKLLRNEIKTEKKVRRKIIGEKETHIEEAMKILEEEKDEIQAVLASNKKGIIFRTASELGSNLPELSFYSLPKEITCFFPGEATAKHIPKLLGSLSQIYISKHESSIHFRVCKSYVSNLPKVDKIVTLDDKTAWISYPTEKALRQIAIGINDKIQIKKNISTKIYDMALTSHGDILLSMYESSEVKLLTKSGEIKPFLSVENLFPLGIHVNRDNSILLGLKVKETADDIKLKNAGCSKILKCGMDGKKKQSYECEKHEERLFTAPHRITTNINKDIVIIDKILEDGYKDANKDNDEINGRIVVLGKEGDLKWTYLGHPHINYSETHSFSPCDIVTTSVGHVIVADLMTSALHVLSRQGDLLTCKLMGDKGVVNPHSLCFDTRGQIWIGCDKIHIVKFCC